MIMMAWFILLIRCHFLWQFTDHDGSRTSWMERAFGGRPELVRVGSRASLCQMTTATSIDNLPLHTVRLATSAKIPVPSPPTPTPTPTTPAVQTTRYAETPPPPPPPTPPTLQTTPLLGDPGLVANLRGPSPSRFVRHAVASGRARSRSTMLPITASWVADGRDLGPRPARWPEVAPTAFGWTSDVRLAEVQEGSKSLDS